MGETIYNEENSLKLAIFRVLAWFDIFNYPLSLFEIWQFMDRKASLAQVQNFLLDSKNDASLSGQSRRGFYYLSGREEIIDTRLARYNSTDKKFKIARRIGRLFRLCPYVKLIAISNLIGAHNLRAESDIDLFIVTTPRRIWLTRLYCAGLAKILNIRPNKKTKQNKICLSFYVDENNLD